MGLEYQYQEMSSWGGECGTSIHCKTLDRGSYVRTHAKLIHNAGFVDAMEYDGMTVGNSLQRYPSVI